MRDIKNTSAELDEILLREEIMWRQRSRAEWISSRDKNMKKFHLQASLRRKKNTIKALKNTLGVAIEDNNLLKNMVRDFYANLYTSEGVHDINAVLDHVPAKVTQ